MPRIRGGRPHEAADRTSGRVRPSGPRNSATREGREKLHAPRMIARRTRRMHENFARRIEIPTYDRPAVGVEIEPLMGHGIDTEEPEFCIRALTDISRKEKSIREAGARIDMCQVLAESVADPFRKRNVVGFVAHLDRCRIVAGPAALRGGLRWAGCQDPGACQAGGEDCCRSPPAARLQSCSSSCDPRTFS
jgi:hypothetical protein